MSLTITYGFASSSSSFLLEGLFDTELGVRRVDDGTGEGIQTDNYALGLVVESKDQGGGRGEAPPQQGYSKQLRSNPV
jgi:hypothetical protein